MGNFLAPGRKHKCVFCEVLDDLGSEEALESDKVLKYDGNLAILKDLHPAAKHHYLVIPREHLANPKVLRGTAHIELVKQMHKFGREYLLSLESPEIAQEALYGFHFPPFISVDHLHLHVICPSTSMNFTNSNLFRKDTWYFVTPEKIIESLQRQLECS